MFQTINYKNSSIIVRRKTAYSIRKVSISKIITARYGMHLDAH
jgi:hypothetical protein